MIVIIDNYDSFTYNLYQLVGSLGEELGVFRNDATTTGELAALNPSHIIISPGPKTPKDAGVSCEVIRAFAGKIPILGVCLGHQCIAEVHGGIVRRAARLMHGKTSPIKHTGTGIFKNVENPFRAMRYHSLIVNEADLPAPLIPTAWTADQNELMACEAPGKSVFGVQFHPESFMTPVGEIILKNFLDTQV